MKQIIYRSMPRVAVSDALLDIVRVAEHRNSRLNVSGGLVYSQKLFIQLLEGPPNAVDQIYASIARDSRHHIQWRRECITDVRMVQPSLPMGYLTETQCAPLDQFREEDASECITAICDALYHHYPLSAKSMGAGG